MIPASAGRYRRFCDSRRRSAAVAASESLRSPRRREPRPDLPYIARMTATPPLPPGVLEAFRRGRTLEAIRLLRAAGFGLKEAKALLEWQARQNTLPARARPREEEPAAPGRRPQPIAHRHAPQPTMASVGKTLSPGEVPRGPSNAFGVGVLLAVGILAALYFLGAG